MEKIFRIVNNTTDSKVTTETILKFIDECPNEDEMRIGFTYWLTLTILSSRNKTTMLGNQKCLSSLINKLRNQSQNCRLESPQLEKFDFIVSELCHTAQKDNKLTSYKDWLSNFIWVLGKFSKFDELNGITSRLSLSLITSIYDIYENLQYEVKSKTSIIQKEVLKEDAIEEMENIIRYREGQAENLFVYLHTLIDLAKSGVMYKSIGKKVVFIVCRIFEKSSLFYMQNSNLLEFYEDCVAIDDYKVRERALMSLEVMLEQEELSTEAKRVVIDFLKTEPIKEHLLHLISENCLIVMKSSLNLIISLQRNNEEYDIWSNEKYDYICLKVFHPNKTISDLVGKFLLDRCAYRARNDGEILLNILDFYMSYKSTPNDVRQLIKSIWSFEHLKSFNNLFAVLIRPTRNIFCSALVAHFVISVYEEMRVIRETYTAEINLLLTKIPLVLNELLKKDEFSCIAILLRIFDEKTMESYSVSTFGQNYEKIIGHLVSVLIRIVKTNKDNYSVAFNVFKIFKGFHELNDFTKMEEIYSLMNSIVQGFWSLCLEWQKDNFVRSPEIAASLRSALIKLTPVLFYMEGGQEIHQEKIFGFLRDYLINDNQFAKFSANADEDIERLAISVFFHLIRLKLAKFDNVSSSLNAEFIKSIKQFVVYLKTALRKENLDLNSISTACETFSNIFLMCAGGNDERKRITFHLKISQEEYDLLHDILIKSVLETEDNVNEPEKIDLKKKIFQSFNLFYKYYNQHFNYVHSWRVLLFYGKTNNYYYMDEIINFMEILLRKRTSKGINVFSLSFAKCLHLIYTQESLLDMQVKNWMAKYFKFLHRKIKEENTLKSIVGHSILILLRYIENDLETMPVNTGENVNRIRILCHLSQHIIFLDESMLKPIFMKQRNWNRQKLAQNEVALLTSFEEKIITLIVQKREQLASQTGGRT